MKHKHGPLRLALVTHLATLALVGSSALAQVSGGRNLLQIALVVMTFLMAPCILQAQQQRENTYWSHRKAVVLAVKWGKDLRFVTATVLEDHARPTLAESLIVVAPSWPMPDWLRPPLGSVARQAYTVCVAHVTDRTEASNPSARHLPEAMRDLLTDGLFGEWMLELSHDDSLTTWADFIVIQETSMWTYGESEKYPDLLHSPEMLAKQRFDLLHTSPGGRWVLDHFQGMEIDSTGRLGSDIDTGYSVYDNATGNRIFYDVSTTAWITLAAWSNDSCFVMTGCKAVEPYRGCDIPVRAPVIWIGNPLSGRLTTFIGAPLSHWKERRVWDGWHKVFRKAYPKVRSVP